MNYRRIWLAGGTYFFTVTLLQRGNNALLTEHIAALRLAVSEVKTNYPFTIHAWVVLPDHLHCVLELPPNDSNYALRWRLIKSAFSKKMVADEPRSMVRQARGERGIWQRRYWAHLITHDADFANHVDYVHINPLKHGLVKAVAEWPHSTFHQHVKMGNYPLDWAGNSANLLLDLE